MLLHPETIRQSSLSRVCIHLKQTANIQARTKERKLFILKVLQILRLLYPLIHETVITKGEGNKAIKFQNQRTVHTEPITSLIILKSNKQLFRGKKISVNHSKYKSAGAWQYNLAKIYRIYS